MGLVWFSLRQSTNIPVVLFFPSCVVELKLPTISKVGCDPVTFLAKET